MYPPKYDERQSARSSTSGARWPRLVSLRMGFPDLWRSAISVRFHVDTRSYTTVRAFVTGSPRGSGDIIFMHFFRFVFVCDMHEGSYEAVNTMDSLMLCS